MKICLVNNLLTPWNRGGAEKIVETLAEAIMADGHEVVFISTKPVKADTPPANGSTHYYLSSYYHNLNKWPYLTRSLWHLIGFFNYRREKILKEILTKESPDLLITNNLVGIGFGLGRLAQSLNIKHFHILHDIQLLHPTGLLMYGRVGELASAPAKLYQRLTQASLGQPQTVIAPSQWLLNEHLKRGFFTKTVSVVINNPIANSLEKVDHSKNNSVFLYVGQIEEYKGVRLLLSAWTDFLTRTKAEAKLIMVGDGFLLNSLKLLKTPQVAFTGRLQKEALDKIYREASCLVVPSLCYENSPTVIYEATQLNLPIIASSLGGIKELLSPDYLFKPELNALSDKLVWANKKRSELTAPQINLISPKEYWAKIKNLF